MDGIRKELRKLRKKLRQIEHLELLDRDLNDEEYLKVSRKSSVRDEVHKLLLELGEETPSFGNYTHQSEPVQDDCSTQDIKETDINNGACTDLDVQMTVKKENNTDDRQAPSDSSKTKQTACETKQSVKPARQDVATAEPEKLSIDKKQPSKTDTVSGTSLPTVPKHNVLKPIQKLEGSKKVKPELPKRIVKKFQEMSLSGHNDLVLSVSIAGNILLSASRDTTIKVWNTVTGEELSSLRGHTGSVTGVLILPEDAWSELVEILKSTEDVEFNLGSHGAISASLDCSVKMWDLDSGRLVKSVYTYNGITSIGYDKLRHSSVTGTDGGKIEVYDLASKTCLTSLKAHNDAVTAVKVCGDLVISASLDSAISVWEWKKDSLCRIFLSDNVKTAAGCAQVPRPIRGFDFYPTKETIYFGDDGFNLKELTWRTGSLLKLRNHTSDFGVTNAIAVSDTVLLSSAYDLDSGRSYINVRSLSDRSYKQSIVPSESGRILCLAASEINGKLTMAFGGSKLTILREVDGSSSGIAISSIIPSLEKDAEDSGEEDDDELETPATPVSTARSLSASKGAETTEGSSRCVIV